MRIKELQEFMKENKIDICIFANNSLNKKDPNLAYFSQMDIEYATLVISRKDEFLFVSPLEYEKARKSSYIKNIQVPKKKLSLSLKNKFNKPKRIGINKKITSLYEYEQLKKVFKQAKFVDVSEECSLLRIKKTKTEIKYIKEACRLADSVIQKLIDNFKFRTEAEIAAFIDDEIKKGGNVPSFSTIVASGRNASQPHYAPQDEILQKGFCVIDFGIRYKNYCSDMTRTIFIGKASGRDKTIYNMLLKAQAESISQINEGIECKRLDNFVRKSLKGYSKNFIHGLGHGIGVEIHEAPNISYKANGCLKNGMVFTVEPGIYLKNRLGIRIEDDILLDKKPVVLTKTTKELLEFRI